MSYRHCSHHGDSPKDIVIASLVGLCLSGLLSVLYVGNVSAIAEGEEGVREIKVNQGDVRRLIRRGVVDQVTQCIGVEILWGNLDDFCEGVISSFFILKKKILKEVHEVSPWRWHWIRELFFEVQPETIIPPQERSKPCSLRDWRQRNSRIAYDTWEETKQCSW
jgi:hypothetical protein